MREPDNPSPKQPFRHRLPGFVGRFLRRCVVRLVGGAVYVIGDLLNIAIGNGLNLSDVWPRELVSVKWPWSQSTQTQQLLDQRSAAVKLESPAWGLQDFLLLTSSDSEGMANAASKLSPQCSIIIPVLNNAELTFQCLRSVFHDVDLSRDEIIVVDNGSTDATPLMLDRLKGKVSVITNETNRGFGAACNQGAAQARGKYLVFLNNDTVVQPGWLKNLEATAESNADVGAVGSMLLSGEGVLQEAGGIVWKDGSARNYGRGEDPSETRFRYAREADYCSGASLLIRKNLFHEVGGFDERYAPAYYEDVDLCFATRSLGFKVFYQPASRVVHYEGGTAGTDLGQNFKRYQHINQAKFEAKWHDVLQREHLDPAFENVEKAILSRRGPRVIVVDSMYTSPNLDAGSLRMTMILKSLARWGSPQMLTETGQISSETEDLLGGAGVEILTGVDYEKVFRADDIRIAILSRPTTASRLLPLIRKANKNIKIIYDTVDLHFLRLDREAKVTGNPQVAADMARMREQETRLAALTDQVWCATTNDEEVLGAEVPEARTRVIPTIHSLHGRGKRFSDREGLLFIGNFNHLPNVDAVHYFISQIFPLVQEKLPGVKFYVIGSNALEEILSYHSADVIVTGYVPDVSPYFESCRVFVAPLRYGAGMKGKIGQALSYGLPTVTTSIGAEGIGLEHKTEAMIADDPRSFAQSIVELYEDEKMWQKLSDKSHSHIGQHYSPEVIEGKILSALQDLIQTDTAGQPLSDLRAVAIGQS